MKYIDAKKDIEKIYQINNITQDVCTILINKLLDESNYYFIALKSINEQAYLTDYAKTCELFDYDENFLKELCSKHNLQFDNWYIQCQYNSIQDLKNFIALLDELAS